MLADLKKIWRLGFPLCITFVIQMVIVMVDSAFAGHISYVDLAAVSLASSAFYILLLLLIGFAVGSSVMAGQAIGANNHAEMINCFRQGAFLCLLTGLGLAISLVYLNPLFGQIGQEPEVVKLSETYLNWLSWTLPIQALIVLIRSYFAVIDKPWASVFPVFVALVLNAFLDYCLATGELGFPNMGIAGIGLASLIANAVLIILMMRNMTWKVTRQIFQFSHPDLWSNNVLGKLCTISAPICVTLVVEEAFFSASVFLAGSLGATEQAAHQIMLNTVGTSFMFNTGLAIACSILISKYVGAGEINKIIPTVKAGWVLAQLFTLPFAIILLFFTDQWINLFLDESLVSDQASITLAKSVMWLVLIMLFVDTIWVIIIEALHGLLDTSFPAFSTLIAYWVVGGPLAWWGTRIAGLGYIWIWTAMLIAALILTVLVHFRLFNRIKNI